MSLAEHTQRPQSTLPVHTPPERPEDAFEQAIWYNHEICNHCFERCKRTLTGRVVHDIGYRDFEHVDRLPTAERAIATDETDEYGYRPLYRPSTACATCGSVRLTANSDILSTQELVDRVPALVDRLQEEGFRVEAEPIYRFIRHAKSLESLQGKDREIFERAVKMGVERAYR